MKGSVIHIMVWGMLLMTVTSCREVKSEVGKRGIMCSSGLMTLDGDTFEIQDRIGDSLLIVRRHSKRDDSSLLIKKENNGRYYVQVKGNSINEIENTQEYVCVDYARVYNLKNKTSFSVSCDASFLYYLGQWKGEAVFMSQDTICFSDGKNVALQINTSCKPVDTEGDVVFVRGARSLKVSLEEVHQHGNNFVPSARDVVRFAKNYYIKPRNPYEVVEAGFDVDLDIPKGITDCDNAIREWIVAAIKDDAFSLVGHYGEIPVGHSGSVEEVIASLDAYSRLWEELCRHDYQVEDTLMLTMPCNINIRRMVDSDEYATYYYWSSIYNGGLHELPKSYYITYDKRRKIFLTASNTILPSKMKFFRTEVLKSLKQKYEENYGGTIAWDDFVQSVFSFHCPMFDMSDWDEITRSLLENNYVCDEWSGWGPVDDHPFTLANFPLPHLAVLPEGIVLSYHPYQIDCFAVGEYHALIPLDKANPCLRYKYRYASDQLTKLEDFIKERRTYGVE